MFQPDGAGSVQFAANPWFVPSWDHLAKTSKENISKILQIMYICCEILKNYDEIWQLSYCSYLKFIWNPAIRLFTPRGTNDSQLLRPMILAGMQRTGKQLATSRAPLPVKSQEISKSLILHNTNEPEPRVLKCLNKNSKVFPEIWKYRANIASGLKKSSWNRKDAHQCFFFLAPLSRKHKEAPKACTATDQSQSITIRCPTCGFPAEQHVLPTDRPTPHLRSFRFQ